MGWLGLATSAGALTITGSGTSLPGGGTCTPSGVSTQTGGATLSCTGLNLGAHSNVYIGINNASIVNGNTMTGSAPGASSAAVFRISATTSNSITYTSTTTLSSQNGFGTLTTTSQLVLTFTGTGSVVAAGGNPANNGNGDTADLFKITGGSSVSINVAIRAQNASFGLNWASTNVYDPAHGSTGSPGEISRVDVKFYWSDCGDGTVDSPEVCDQGAANGTTGSCCSSTCTLKATGTVCRAAAGFCDLQEVCTGSSATCPTDAKVVSGTVCRAAAGTCDIQRSLQRQLQHLPGRLPRRLGIDLPGVGRRLRPGRDVQRCERRLSGVTARRRAARSAAPRAASATSPRPATGRRMTVRPTPSSPPALECRASAGFCDVAENCPGNAATCPADTFQPTSLVCRAAVDACDATETCSGSGPTCPADSKKSTSTICRAAAGACDVAETCDGVSDGCASDAIRPSGFVCNAGSGDLCDTDETCDGSGTACPADTIAPSGTLCRAGSGDTCDPDEVCTGVADQPCPCKRRATGFRRLPSRFGGHLRSGRALSGDSRRRVPQRRRRSIRYSLQSGLG